MKDEADRRDRGHAAAGVDRRAFLKGSAVATAGLIASSVARPARAQASPLIVDVSNVPVPDFTATNRHPGIEVLLRTLACNGTFFYRAPGSYPLSDPVAGLIAPDDVVLLKVNGQWRFRGITNSDVVRGIVQRILDHPLGFTGEVVLFENGQGRGSLDALGSLNSGWYDDNERHANAEDDQHSFQYLIDQVFADPRVSGYLLDGVRRVEITANDHATPGYRRDGFVSYPCFPSGQGTRIELKDGIWDGGGHAQNLKLINVPVFKTHGGSAVTGALKHMYGVLSMNWNSGPYHYARIGDACGDMHATIRTPVLNIVDCIWVSPGELAGYPASATVRTNRLLAGHDPAALDYYAGKHVLYPAGGNPYHDPDTSADFQAMLTQARDRINSYGGLGGVPVTFDETEFVVRAADASTAPAPVELHVRREGSDGVRLEWLGGNPPFRVWRSENRDLSSPTLLTDCCQERFWVDAGRLRDGRRYYYSVE